MSTGVQDSTSFSKSDQYTTGSVENKTSAPSEIHSSNSSFEQKPILPPPLPVQKSSVYIPPPLHPKHAIAQSSLSTFIPPPPIGDTRRVIVTASNVFPGEINRTTHSPHCFPIQAPALVSSNPLPRYFHPPPSLFREESPLLQQTSQNLFSISNTESKDKEKEKDKKDSSPHSSKKSQSKKGSNSPSFSESLYVITDQNIRPWAEGRYRHSSIVWKGSIYVFGGSLDLDLYLNSIAVYEIETQKWKSLLRKPSPPARHSHSAMEYDNLMYVFGGVSKESELNDIWTFDLKKQKWQGVAVSGNVPIPRSGHSAVLFRDAMYVFGGKTESGLINDLYRFDFLTNRWNLVEPVTPPPSPRSFHACVVVGFYMYVLCGETENNTKLCDFHRFNLLKNTWHSLSVPEDILGNRVGLCAVVYEKFESSTTECVNRRDSKQSNAQLSPVSDSALFTNVLNTTSPGQQQKKQLPGTLINSASSTNSDGSSSGLSMTTYSPVIDFPISEMNTVNTIASTSASSTSTLHNETLSPSSLRKYNSDSSFRVYSKRNINLAQSSTNILPSRLYNTKINGSGDSISSLSFSTTHLPLIVVTGGIGQSFGPVDTCVYDVTTRHWHSPVTAGGEIIASRVNHSAVVYKDQIYVLGGFVFNGSIKIFSKDSLDFTLTRTIRKRTLSGKMKKLRPRSNTTDAAQSVSDESSEENDHSKKEKRKEKQKRSVSTRKEDSRNRSLEKQKETQMNELKQWLDQRGLIVAFSVLIEEEVSSVTALLSLNENDLKTLNLKAGIRISLSREIQNSRRKQESQNQNFILTSVVKTREIGCGNFGTVFEGLWGGTTPVAMKKMISNDDKEFENELSLLKTLRHPNCVIFYGLFLDSETDEKFMCIEYMPLGSLKKFLKESETLSNDTLLSISIGASAGMNYLSKNNIVHRDLAARNILVARSDDGYTAKVTDFGLSRAVSEGQYEATSKMCPIKWTAPEALFHQLYTSRSDVWSFGVVLWEIFEHGKNPYHSLSNSETIEYVKEGNRLGIPLSLVKPTFGKRLYDLMLSCWNDDPEKRPLFEDIHKELSEIRASISSDKEESKDNFVASNEKKELESNTLYYAANSTKDVYYENGNIEPDLSYSSSDE